MFVVKLVHLNIDEPIWPHFYTVAPLVVIGTKEGDAYDMAPKHMAMPLGRDNYFGFMCTPAHSTWHNVVAEGYFTVSFPKPDQVVLASLAASPRCGEQLNDKPVLAGLPTFKSELLDALFLKQSYLYLECRLLKVVKGFGRFGLIAGEIIGAHVDEDHKIWSEGDDDAMIHKSPLLAYIAHGRFAAIRNTHEFPFPRGFEKGTS